jgi:general stress protein 26
MAIDPHDHAAVQTRLWDHLEKRQTGMLGLIGSHQHFQPMTAFLEREDNRIWFFTYRDTDLAEAVGPGTDAMFVLQDEHKLYACVGGRIRQQHDIQRIDRYWNAQVAAWYPGGKDDPRLTLLCLEAEDAEVWLSEGGPMKYAFQVARANATKTTPDVGGRTHLDLH